MSNRYQNWAWDLPLKKSGSKFVLICLADMTNDSGFCYPKQSTIAKRTGFNLSTVNRHIHFLQKKGLITKKGQRYKDGRRRSSTYQLNFQNNFLPCADLQPAEIQHDQVLNPHNRIPHRDPILDIGGIH